MRADRLTGWPGVDSAAALDNRFSAHIGGSDLRFEPPHRHRREEFGDALARCVPGWYAADRTEQDTLQIIIRDVAAVFPGADGAAAVTYVQALLTEPTLKRRRTEIGILIVRLGAYPAVLFVWLSPGLAAAFLGVQLTVTGLYLGVSFASHIGMPILPHDSRVDFFRRQVLTPRNIRGGRAASFAMSGLNYQIEHHLFPNMGRPNLGTARRVVQQFCADRDGSPAVRQAFCSGRCANPAMLCSRSGTTSTTPPPDGCAGCNGRDAYGVGSGFRRPSGRRRHAFRHHKATDRG